MMIADKELFIKFFMRLFYFLLGIQFVRVHSFKNQDFVVLCQFSSVEMI